MATYYVNADSGNNANAGSLAAPWETITYALTQMSAGDILIIEEATAHYTITHGDILNGVALQGEAVDTCILDGITNDPEWAVRGTVSVKGVSITQVYGANRERGFFCIDQDGSAFTLQGCKIFGNRFGGQPTSGGRGGFITARGNFFSTASKNNTLNVVGCLFHSNPGGFDSLIQARLFQVAGIGVDNTSVANILNNTIVIPEPVGAERAIVDILYGNGGDTWTLKNNIFATYQSISDVDLRAGGGIINIERNCFFAAPGSLGFDLGGATSEIDTFTDDPLFVDAPNDDYNLAPGSPYIGSGVLI